MLDNLRRNRAADFFCYAIDDSAGSYHNSRLEVAVSATMLDVRTERIQKQIDELTAVVASPEFIGMVAELEAAPEGERYERVRAFADRKLLAEHGVGMSDEFRITTRVFEDPEVGRAKVGELPSTERPAGYPMMGFCGSVGFFACVSYGE